MTTRLEEYFSRKESNAKQQVVELALIWNLQGETFCRRRIQKATSLVESTVIRITNELTAEGFFERLSRNPSKYTLSEEAKQIQNELLSKLSPEKRTFFQRELTDLAEVEEKIRYLKETFKTQIAPYKTKRFELREVLLGMHSSLGAK